MKKLDIVAIVSIVLASIGVICFWIFGLNKAVDLAVYAIVVAGVCAWVFVVCLLLPYFRNNWEDQ